MLSAEARHRIRRRTELGLRLRAEIGWRAETADRVFPLHTAAVMARSPWFITLVALVEVAGCGHAAGLAPSSEPACPAAPAGRTSAFSFYDRDQQKVLVYGGEPMAGYGRVADMWAWDGRCWAVLRPADGQLPGPRSRGFTAYDPDHHRILLFGGQGQDAPALRQLWSWAGGRWTRLPDAPVSAIASDGAMAYDAGRHQLVLVITPLSARVGNDRPTSSPMETWLYDGEAWRRAAPPHPFPYNPSAAVSSAAFDPTSQHVLVARMASGPTEIWSWDGHDWSISDHVPSARVRDLIAAGELGILAADGGDPLSPEGQLRPVYQLQGGRWILAGNPTVGPVTVLAPAYDQHRKELVTFSDIAQPSQSEQVFTADTWTWTPVRGWTKHPGPAPSPSPSASLTPAALPSQTPGPTPPAFPTAGPRAADLQCRLPMAFDTGGSSQDTSYRAFVQFPEGRVTITETFAGTLPKWTAYVRPGNRWLPLDWTFILPDETGYVEVETEQQAPYTTRLHLFDSATAHERLLQVPTPDGAPRFGYWLRGYRHEGAYVSEVALATEDGGHGLWLLDTNTGTRRELAPFGYWPIIAAGGAWGYANDDTVAPAPNGFAAFNSVVRLDLGTGQTQTWLTTPGRRIDILGIDASDRLLVEASNGSFESPSVAELRLLSAPGQWRTYPVPGSSTSSGLAPTYFTGVTDANGIWIDGANEIYLFDADHGLRLVMAGGYILNVAGPCA